MASHLSHRTNGQEYCVTAVFASSASVLRNGKTLSDVGTCAHHEHNNITVKDQLKRESYDDQRNCPARRWWWSNDSAVIADLCVDIWIGQSTKDLIQYITNDHKNQEKLECCPISKAFCHLRSPAGIELHSRHDLPQGNSGTPNTETEGRVTPSVRTNIAYAIPPTTTRNTCCVTIRGF